VTEELQGWQPDPFGRHQSRYFSAGRPTYLVRDGQVEGSDPVEQIPPQAQPRPVDAAMPPPGYPPPGYPPPGYGPPAGYGLPVVRPSVMASPWSVPGDAVRTSGRHGTPGYNGRMAVMAAVVVVLLVGVVIIAVAATRHQRASTASRLAASAATVSSTPVASPAVAAGSPAVATNSLPPTNSPLATNSPAMAAGSQAVGAGVMVASTSGHFSARFPSAPIQQSVDETISGVHASIRVAVVRTPLTEVAEEDIANAVPANEQALALRSAIAVAASTAGNGSPTQQSDTTFRGKASRTSTFTTAAGEQITAIAFFQDSRTVYFLLADAGAPFQNLSASLQFDAASPPQVLS
jgi:hypothetical protein